MLDYLIIGQIVKPQGVKGQLKIKVLSEDANRFDNIKTVFMKTGEQYEAFTIESSDTRDEYAYITLSNIHDRNAADKLRNKFLYINRENAIKLEADKYFICDLIGIKVYTDSGEKIGILKDILQTGSADIYCIKGKKSLMFPALKKLIEKVDLEKEKIIVNGEVLKEVAVYED